jgi:hypothetical protein
LYPKANAAVLAIPAPFTPLAVFKSPTSVQLVPSYFSVKAELDPVLPPKAKAAVYIPDLLKFL